MLATDHRTYKSAALHHYMFKRKEAALPAASRVAVFMMSGGAEQHQDNNDAERHAEEPKDDRHGQGLPTVTVTGTR
jgi:hypothetical protein